MSNGVTTSVYFISIPMPLGFVLLYSVIIICVPPTLIIIILIIIIIILIIIIIIIIGEKITVNMVRSDNHVTDLMPLLPKGKWGSIFTQDSVSKGTQVATCNQ